MSDESADNDPKSSKKKSSKSKSSKSAKQKSSGAQARTEPAAETPDIPESPGSESPEKSPGSELLEKALPSAIVDLPTTNVPGTTDTPVARPEIESTSDEPRVAQPVEPVELEPVEPESVEPESVEPVRPEIAPDATGREPTEPLATLTTKAAEGGTGGGDDGDRETLPPGWPEPAPRFVVSNVVTIILGIVAIGLVVGLVLTTLSLSNKNSLESARSGALNAARTYSIELSSYNYQHLNQDFATVESHSTASFKKSFSQSSDALKSTLIKFKASSTATILASAVVTATSSRVVTLIFLSQTVSNSTQKTPTTDRTQIQMTLVNTGGQWLIDVVTIL
jgi:Mce-associated membrane protein